MTSKRLAVEEAAMGCPISQWFSYKTNSPASCNMLLNSVIESQNTATTLLVDDYSDIIPPYLSYHNYNFSPAEKGNIVNCNQIKYTSIFALSLNGMGVSSCQSRNDLGELHAVTQNMTI